MTDFNKSLGATPQQANPTPKVETFYALRRETASTKTSLVQVCPQGTGSFKVWDFQPEYASLFTRMTYAIAALVKRNDVLSNLGGTLHLNDRFALVKVIKTTAKGGRVVKVAEPGVVPTSYAIRTNSVWFLRSDVLLGSLSPNYSKSVENARAFGSRLDAVEHAVSGKLPSNENIWNIEFVGLTESTTPDVVTYEVVEL